MNTLEKIYGSTLRFLIPLDLQETYKNIIDEALKIVDGDSGRIFMSDAGEFTSVYSSITTTPLNDPRKRGNVYISFSKNKAFIAHEREVIRTYPDLTESGIRSIIYIPLANNNVCYGVMTIRSKKDRKFSKGNLEVLKIFGSMASMAIRKAQLYSDLEKSIKDRDLFISLASHELRTPLTTINGYIQLLLSRLRNKKPIDRAWVMELAFETQRMKNLIEEFLEINRIRSGKLQFNFIELNFSEIIKHVISTFKLNFPKRKLKVENKLNKDDLIVIADPDKLHQVFMNILENAVKYSDPNTDISLELSNNTDYMRVSISDKGQGIEEKDMPLVFKGFYKGKNSLHEGMGLGLYLSRHIIQMHQGKIKVKSRPNVGTKIIIELPRSRK